MEVWSEIEEVIFAAAKAGVFRQAERLNPGTASIWNECAEPHSRRVAALLGTAIGRHSGEAVTRPQAR